MKLTNLFLALVVPFALSMACGGKSSNGDGDGDGDGDGNSTPPSSSDGKDDACEEFCEQVESCDGVVVEECVESCTDNTTTSRSGQEVVNECFDEELCEGVTEESGTAALLCVITGLDDIELSDEAKTYCSESVDAINACLGSEPEDTFGNCEDTIGVASDELLAGLNECAGEECEDVQGCLEFELLKSLPLEALLALGEADGDIPPALLAEMVPVIVAFSHLGLDDGGDLEDIFGEPPETTEPTDPGMGGAAGR